MTGVRAVAGRHRLRRAGNDNLPSASAALGAHIDDPVGGLDHIEIVFDHDHGVAGIPQSFKYFKKRCYIFKMQACCWLIEHI